MKRFMARIISCGEPSGDLAAVSVCAVADVVDNNLFDRLTRRSGTLSFAMSFSMGQRG